MRPGWIVLGLVLLAAGLSGHVMAARAIGGAFQAYRDHLVGFAILTIVAAAVLAGLGARFWRGRWDVTVLALGVVQAALGLFVYFQRYHFA
ncbi:MAG: hypothetical protein U0132_05020 [Gemmatimonadaceae bacterium]